MKPHLLLALWSITGLAGPVAQAESDSQRLGFSYTYPTNFSDWPDGLMAGDGKMGIIVFGDPLHDRVIYNDRGFNMAKTTDRWFAQVSAADLAAIKSNCATGHFREANDLAVTSAHYRGGGEGNRHPGYEMLISIPPGGQVSNYARLCDFRTGEITVKWTDDRGEWVRRSFVSRRDDVVVQYLTAPSRGTLTCSIQLATEPGMSFPRDWTFSNASSADYLRMRVKYPENTDGAGYEGVTRVKISGGTTKLDGDVLEISNAASVMLLTRTAKYYTNCVIQWNQQLLQSQLAAIPADYEALLNGQKATHQAIYDRVKLDLNASPEDRARPNEELLAMQRRSRTPVKALWERVFDAGRYYFLSSSSDQSPPDLLGLWAGDCNAGWGGFYHLDANLNLQVAAGNIGDMPEAMEGYFKINERWRGDQTVNAQKLLGCRGMLACGNTPGMATGAALLAGISYFYPYQYATGEEGWLLYPFWEHYLITGDTNFLRDRLYPLLKDMGHFYEDYLTLSDTNGHYIFAGSVSPENQPSNVHISLLNNSTFDIAGAKFALSALIQSCNTLGLDQGPGQGVATWSKILDKLPPYLVNADHALQEWSWPGLADNYGHRHASHLVTVWPYREITPESTPGLFNAATVVLSKKDAYHEVAGHGVLHGAFIAAGLKNGTSVNKRLLQLTREDYYYDSLYSSHNSYHGTPCTDTCNAVPGVMMEMLVGSSPGILELLPALPPTLNQGAISGVKGRDRLTIQDLSWNMDSNSVHCTLKSDIDQSLTLIERRGIETIMTGSHTSLSPLGRIARNIQLKAGQSTDIALGLSEPGVVTPPGLPVSLAINRPVTVSSEADDCPGPNAVDGDEGTRWSSAHTDNEWIYVDLGAVTNLTGVRLIWESAFAKAYKIQVSNDAKDWTDVYTTSAGNGGTERLRFSAAGRYVRMLGLKRGSIYGYSIWEFEVYGGALSAPLGN
jgi:alpha-L-fucosidase 2